VVGGSVDLWLAASFGRTRLEAHPFECGASNADPVHRRLHLPSACQLLSQHSPTRGEWSSPDEQVHPDEYEGGTADRQSSRVPSGRTDSRFTSAPRLKVQRRQRFRHRKSSVTVIAIVGLSCAAAQPNSPACSPVPLRLSSHQSACDVVECPDWRRRDGWVVSVMCDVDVVESIAYAAAALAAEKTL
jgi:hypothetical protein